jgi:hypothetical protein
MLIIKNKTFISLILTCLCGCSGFEKTEYDKQRQKNSIKERVCRQHDNYFFPLLKPKKNKIPIYPWEEDRVENLPRITKEFFRCRGSSAHAARIDLGGDKLEDCKGSTKHSLPIIEGREGIYPILIDLMNYLQKRTKKKVVVTCGHRCPDHNKYADDTKKNRCSKHLIGAEVDFYIQGLEEKSQKIIEMIFEYYQKNKFYNGKNEYQNFSRYKLSDTGVSIAPWYNKEIFIKLYKENEGRDFDNRHPYPYISIQVRYDKRNKKRVLYNWERSVNGYMRW